MYPQRAGYEVLVHVLEMRGRPQLQETVELLFTQHLCPSWTEASHTFPWFYSLQPYKQGSSIFYCLETEPRETQWMPCQQHMQDLPWFGGPVSPSHQKQLHYGKPRTSNAWPMADTQVRGRQPLCHTHFLS